MVQLDLAPDQLAHHADHQGDDLVLHLLIKLFERPVERSEEAFQAVELFPDRNASLFLPFAVSVGLTFTSPLLETLRVCRLLDLIELRRGQQAARLLDRVLALLAYVRRLPLGDLGLVRTDDLCCGGSAFSHGCLA